LGGAIDLLRCPSFFSTQNLTIRFMKTFALILERDTNIAGTLFPAGFQVGAITSEVNPMDLLGLVQFHHCRVEEVTDAEDSEPAFDEAEAEAEYQSDVAVEAGEQSAASESAPSAESQPMLPLEATETQPGADLKPEPIDQSSAIAKFVADGLDEKTARALVVTNNIASPDVLKTKLADPAFSLADLDEIGKSRQEKIMATYLS
jgi:hypothetical protein